MKGRPALRPEIAAALKGQVGSSLRVSSTFHVRYFYVAIPYRGGALRLSVPAATLDAEVYAIRNDVLLFTALAFFPFVILAAIFARYVSINSFTETQLRSVQRGEIMRWTARPGHRQVF